MPKQIMLMQKMRPHLRTKWFATEAPDHTVLNTLKASLCYAVPLATGPANDPAMIEVKKG